MRRPPPKEHNIALTLHAIIDLFVVDGIVF